MSRRIRLTERLAAACVTALLVSAPSGAAAHDIPNDVTVYAFLKPEGQRLNLLVRVPLTALIDVDWPRRGLDRLDLEGFSAIHVLRSEAEIDGVEVQIEKGPVTRAL